MTVALLLALAAPAAHADTFAAPGMVELLPAPEATGDGKTPVALHVLALSPTGQALTGMTLKPKSKSASITGWRELGGGLYRIDVTPALVDAPSTYDLKVKGKTLDKDSVLLTAELPVRPPLSTALTATINPAELVLGDDEAATLSIQLEGGEGQPLEGGDIAVRVSAGEIQNLTDMGGGRFTAKYIPPKATYPHLALITAADRRDPDLVFAQVAVRLVVRRTESVKAQPNSTVVVKVGDKQFGPVEASRSGAAKVDVTLGPGDTEATLVSVVDGENTEAPLDLKIPVTPRIQLYPVQQGVPADAALRIPIRVMVRTPQGAPDTAASVELSTTAGTIGRASHEGDGIYRADLTPPSTPGSGAVTVTAKVGEDQEDTLEIKVVGPRPTTLTQTADPDPLPADATALSVDTTIKGPDGAGLAGYSFTLYPTGAKVGAVQDLGGGDYRTELTTTGSGPVEVLSVASAPVPGNPLRRLVVVPQRERVPNDGISGNMLTVIAADEFGYPVPGVAVNLFVDGGGGSLPATTTTGADGTAQVFYTTARSAELVTVRASVDDHRATTCFLQVPADVADVDLPLSGSAADIAIDASWASVVGHLRVERGN